MSDSYRIEKYKDEDHGRILRERQKERKFKQQERQAFFKEMRIKDENDQREPAFGN
jgi:hypothetical protein